MTTGVLDSVPVGRWYWWFMNTYPILPGASVTLIVRALNDPLGVKAAFTKAEYLVAWHETASVASFCVGVIMTALLHVITSNNINNNNDN